ncbi:hematopoietic lineage cell-specific protein-like isoform 2-T2 [Discoglossus pictus]
MWKASVGHNVSVVAETGDDWETDPDFVNDITEEEQRWGAKTVAGSGRPQHVNINQLRSSVSKEHEHLKKKELEDGPRASFGYGGKFGTEKDRMDKSALGHEYQADLEKHSSQTDAAKGFGGKYGVQKDRSDKSAVGFEYKAEVQQHSSQQDYSHGFGGKFGVQKDRQDKSAHSWSHKEELKQHQSQIDHSQGFGGKFGIQKDRQDKSAHSWSHKEELQPHQSQTDYAKGFGGRYGVETDRVDKCAAGFGEIESPSSVYQKTQPLEALTSGTHDLRSRFENMARSGEEENRLREEERARRQKRDQQELKKESPQSRSVEPPRKLLVPVPKPRVSVLAPLEPVDQLHGLDAVHGEPPVEPPKLVGVELELEVPPPEMYQDEEQYEDIPAPQDEREEEYEAIPDLPLKREEQDEEDYEEMVDPPEEQVEGLYEELPREEEEPHLYAGHMEAAGISAVAIYDYDGAGDDEISFQPQDIITDIEMMDEGWWTGTCNGRRGLFPANYVEVIQS